MSFSRCAAGSPQRKSRCSAAVQERFRGSDRLARQHMLDPPGQVRVRTCCRRVHLHDKGPLHRERLVVLRMIVPPNPTNPADLADIRLRIPPDWHQNSTRRSVSAENDRPYVSGVCAPHRLS